MRRRDESRQASEFNTFFGKLDQATKDWWVKEASFSFAFRLRVTKDDFERLVPSTDRGVSKGNLWSRGKWPEYMVSPLFVVLTAAKDSTRQLVVE